MILLIAFAFLAGIITVLSPCILPILPIILSSSIGGAKPDTARPLGVVTGFIISFSFFTLFLSSIVRISGLPADSLRTAAIIMIGLFGLALVSPQSQILLERLFSLFSQRIPQQQNKTGFVGGCLIGLSIGLLWTPCVGPILASVISLAITGTVTLDAVLITLAYAAGTAIPMFFIIFGGQNILRKTPWLLPHLGLIQKLFGVLMILTAIGLFFNIDRSFQTYILEKFPSYGAELTRIEDNALVKKQLENKKSNQNMIGKPSYEMSRPKGIKAPELIAGGEWFNSQPLILEKLKGKVVIIDFWTYTCINCQRTLPYLRTWHERYADKGLIIIGVHSPEFEFEKNAENVQRAIADFELPYPVMQDNDFTTWRAYDNRYWPAKYIIDKEGYIRYSHFGEGAYDETERVIQQLLNEKATGGIIDTKVRNPQYHVYSKTPETYLGFARIARLASPENITPHTAHLYTHPVELGRNEVSFAGTWTIAEEYALPANNAQLRLDFESKEVFLVMRSSKPSRISISIDGKKQYFGEDNKDGIVTVTTDRLYKLINLPEPGRHLLQLEFIDGDAELFAFTFG